MKETFFVPSLNKAHAEARLHQFQGGPGTQFVIDVLQMFVNRSFGNPQFRRDLPAAKTFHNGTKDLSFPQRQPVHSIGRDTLHPLHHSHRDFIAVKELPRYYRANGKCQHIRFDISENDTLCTRVYHTLDHKAILAMRNS